MLRIMFCFSCCQSPDSAYKRSIRTTVNKRNEKLTEVANFDDMIGEIKEDLSEQKHRRQSNESQTSLISHNRNDDDAAAATVIESSSLAAVIIDPDDQCLDDKTSTSESEGSLALALAEDKLNNEEEINRIKEYTRLDYTALTDADSSNESNEPANNQEDDSVSTTMDNNENNDDDKQRKQDDQHEKLDENDEHQPAKVNLEDNGNEMGLLPNIEETNLDEDLANNSEATISEPTVTKTETTVITKPPRPSTELATQQLQQQQQQEAAASSHAALASPLSNSESSLISSLGSISFSQSHMGSRMSWDTTNNGGDTDDLVEQDTATSSRQQQDGINYDHEFICSRLDEIFNQQMSLLNIDANQLAYENIAIIIAYDKTDPKNNNRLICFATSKTGSIRSDDLNLTSMIDMRAATMARRALLLYLYKEIDIINANNNSTGKVLSQDAYLLERSYKMRQAAGYKIKTNIGLSMYLNRIESTSIATLSQQGPPSRSSSRASGRAEDPVDTSSTSTSTQAPAEQPSILRLKSIDHKISLWNVLGLQGSILGMMIEPIYLDHIILGQVDDLKRLKTLQSKSTKSSLSAHANKPYRLACPKLLLWRDDCQAVYKNISMIRATVDLDSIDADRGLHSNSLNWTYHDYLDDQAAELIEIKTGAVKCAYPNKQQHEQIANKSANNDDIQSTDEMMKDGGEQQAVGSRLCKSQMMQRLIKVMTNANSYPFLIDGHNGARFFDNIEPGTRVTYRALKNLAFQYNYVKYLCSPIFMNDLRVAAGGIDWVNSYDKVKNYEDQINCKVPFSQSSEQFNVQRIGIVAEGGMRKSLTDLMNEQQQQQSISPNTDKLKEVERKLSEVEGDRGVSTDKLDGLEIPNVISTRPLRSIDNSLPDLSNRLFLASQSSTVSSPVSMSVGGASSSNAATPTPTPSEISSTKSKKFRAKAFLKKFKPGKKKKKSGSAGQLDNAADDKNFN